MLVVRSCDIRDLDLKIPASHAPALQAWFDGKGRDKALARAVSDATGMRIEAEGGRLVLIREEQQLVASALEVQDDRAGEFFGRVVVSLCVTYLGTLKCTLAMEDHERGSSEAMPVEVQGGKTDWSGEFTAGAWLPDRAVVPFDPALIEQAPGGPEPLPDDVQRKLEEARRHFAEYLRLKTDREGAGR